MSKKITGQLIGYGSFRKTVKRLYRLYDSSDRIANLRGKISYSVLNKKSKKCVTISDYFRLSSMIFDSFPLNYLAYTIRPSQIEEEIEDLLNILRKRKISSMLEIGTYDGGTLFLFTKIIEPNGKIISLDLPGGEFGGGYKKNKRLFYTNFTQKNQRIFLIQDDSHSPTSLDKINSILNEKKLDFLFIDGDHSYIGIKQDYQIFNPLVKKGGIIAFHDICQNPLNTNCEVNRFWNEIKLLHPHKEIIRNHNQRWAGIGVLYK